MRSVWVGGSKGAAASGGLPRSSFPLFSALPWSVAQGRRNGRRRSTDPLDRHCGLSYALSLFAHLLNQGFVIRPYNTLVGFFKSKSFPNLSNRLSVFLQHTLSVLFSLQVFSTLFPGIFKSKSSVYPQTMNKVSVPGIQQ